MLKVETDQANAVDDQTDDSDSKLNDSQTRAKSLKEQFKQSEKDRTLFCINIDQKCTENILYELFLQVNVINLELIDFA